MILTIWKRANAVWFISCFCLKFYVDYEMQIWNTDLEADVNINATKIMSTYLRQFLMWISISRFFSSRDCGFIACTHLAQNTDLNEIDGAVTVWANDRKRIHTHTRRPTRGHWTALREWESRSVFDDDLAIIYRTMNFYTQYSTQRERATTL